MLATTPMGLLPEIEKTGLLHFVQESVVFRRKRHIRTGNRSAGQRTRGGHSLQ